MIFISDPEGDTILVVVSSYLVIWILQLENSPIDLSFPVLQIW